jgi:c-di-GMP-related signal transduction protein
VLSRLPGANVKFVAKEIGVVISDTHFLKLVAEYNIKEIQSADILEVPGAVVSLYGNLNKTVLNWLEKAKQLNSSGFKINVSDFVENNKNVIKGWDLVDLITLEFKTLNS